MSRKKVMTIICLVVMIFATNVYAAQDAQDTKPTEEPKKEVAFKVPDSVLDISKDNTYPNPTQDLPYLQPSDMAQELIETAEVAIENPDLIRILNESNISAPPTAIGYRATIYLGQWPLNYESTETSANWEFQLVNTNMYDNRGGKKNQQMSYKQDAQKHVRGGLTAKVPNAEEVKKMMMLKAAEKTGLPLSFETYIGLGTKKAQVYNVPTKKLGYLYAHAPAINEKGKVTYGEVYLVLKGSKKMLVIKNITRQGIGAWIPVQDHLTFGFVTSETPR
ncbi:hypothetical protein EJF36_03825 [Bacillus sp. HMF5848]|nr:hypothetical protein EJF36_03825 [Bacillus sp. HMF5848]